MRKRVWGRMSKRGIDRFQVQVFKKSDMITFNFLQYNTIHIHCCIRVYVQ